MSTNTRLSMKCLRCENLEALYNQEVQISKLIAITGSDYIKRQADDLSLVVIDNINLLENLPCVCERQLMLAYPV